jgi:hypothetical protein
MHHFARCGQCYEYIGRTIDPQQSPWRLKVWELPETVDFGLHPFLLLHRASPLASRGSVSNRNSCGFDAPYAGSRTKLAAGGPEPGIRTANPRRTTRVSLQASRRPLVPRSALRAPQFARPQVTRPRPVAAAANSGHPQGAAFAGHAARVRSATRASSGDRRVARKPLRGGGRAGRRRVQHERFANPFRIGEV